MARYTVTMKKLLSLVPILTLFLPFAASAAHIYFDPNKGTFGPADTFVLNLRIDNEDDCINAAHVEITYPTASLRAVDFSRGDSIFTLWPEEPSIDTQKGVVGFSGGVPGGYCGRINGDPSLTNVIGKVVFTVINSAAKKADISISGTGSKVYLNDGKGTEASLHVDSATITLVASSTGAGNAWLQQVKQDTTPPDPFDVIIESTRGVFGGNYYLVFSTVDKQSGIDHYEVYEKGSWKTTSSPYQLKDQVLHDIKVRAIDKAGNERFGDVSSTTPPRQVSLFDFPIIMSILTILLVLGLLLWWRDRRISAPADSPTPPAPTP